MSAASALVHPLLYCILTADAPTVVLLNVYNDVVTTNSGHNSSITNAVHERVN